jgi:precorrin-4 methylase
MSFTLDQIADLERAIATGARSVRNANGEMVTYGSLAEMRQTLAMMKADIAGVSSSRVVSINPVFSNGC